VLDAASGSSGMSRSSSAELRPLAVGVERQRLRHAAGEARPAARSSAPRASAGSVAQHVALHDAEKCALTRSAVTCCTRSG